MAHLPEFLDQPFAQCLWSQAGHRRAGDDHRVQVGKRVLVQTESFAHRPLHAVPRHRSPEAASGDHKESRRGLLLAQDPEREQRSFQTLTVLKHPGDIPPLAEAVLTPKGWAHRHKDNRFADRHQLV